MSDQGKMSDVAFKVENSEFYRIYIMEQKEIEKHKWVLSERAGREIPWNEARWSWDMLHRKEWLKSVRANDA